MVKGQSNNIPVSKTDLEAFRLELKEGWIQLREREIHVSVTLKSAQKQIDNVDDDVC